MVIIMQLAYEEVAVVIAFLTPDPDLHLVEPSIPRRLQKVFRQQLLLLVEIVAGALHAQAHHGQHHKSKLVPTLQNAHNRSRHARACRRASR